MIIESFQNDKIKNLVRLNTDNRFRKNANVFVVEGKQENERAQNYCYEPVEFFICESVFNSELPSGKINLVSEKVYEKIAYRGSSEGIIGVYKAVHQKLGDFIPNENSAVMIIEGVEKPGNLGAILRSCEAFGIEALIITDAKTDFYNPNVIRSSVGCLFGMNIFTANNQETLQYLRKHKYDIFSTYMDESAENIDHKNLTGKTAVVFGTEHSGITDFWHHQSENILIPMAGTIDSLNLSNAVAITCYEILRQRIKSRE